MEFTDYDTRLAAYALIVDDSDRVLLTWFNGSERSAPGWTLPGGGVEYDETLVEAVVREVHEEAGYDVEVGAPLVAHSWTTRDDGPRPPRPYKAVRVVFDARIVGGELGTLETGGTTDHAEWIPLSEVRTHASRADIVDVAVSAWRRSSEREPDHR
ncbi:MAG: NUDIX domain-containing protein [Nocardioides sp.]